MYEELKQYFAIMVTLVFVTWLAAMRYDVLDTWFWFMCVVGYAVAAVLVLE
jgi:hypothetical protein